MQLETRTLWPLFPRSRLSLPAKNSNYLTRITRIGRILRIFMELYANIRVIRSIRGIRVKNYQVAVFSVLTR